MLFRHACFAIIPAQRNRAPPRNITLVLSLPTLATALTEPLEVIGLWLGTAGIFGGAAASWSYLLYGTDAEIASAAQRGAAVGFVVGFFVAIVATVYLGLS